MDDPNVMFCGGRINVGQSNPPPGTFRTIAVGTNHACGVRTDGTVACWGAGMADDCVAGSMDCRQSRPPSSLFEQVTASSAHSCAMTGSRKVTCWGADGGGRTMPPVEFQ
jgi:alpha-tubulin suppressor-like RCC1 family protein